jgi:hypothetical protein
MSASQFAIQCVQLAQERIKKILSDQTIKVPTDVRKSLMDSFDDLHRADVCLNMRKEDHNEAKGT